MAENAEQLSPEAFEEEAPPRSISQLMWRRFCRNRWAYWSLWVIGALYVMMAFSDFIAPHLPVDVSRGYRMMPPTHVHLRDQDGSWHRPFVYRAGASQLDRITFLMAYPEDTSQRFPIRFFVAGVPHRALGFLWTTTLHLWGTGDPTVPVFVMGTDGFGRDMFSRILYGSRVSLSIGMVGVFLTIIFGSLLGVTSGYYGGTVDILMQRLIEIIQAIPTLPLWLALAAIVPATWSSVATYFMITIILSLIGWTGLARSLRGMTLRLRQSDLVVAARCIGASDWRIIVRHIMPYNTSLIVVSATLSIPGTIMGETGLSFLGLGIRPPMVSWGVLLAQAQNINNVAFHPWLMWPAVFLIVAVLAFNFVGDGVRDATDPYTH